MNKKYILILFLVVFVSQLSASYIGRSMLIPGLGERKLGYEQQSKNFFIAEAAIWTTYILLGDFSSSYENDYRNYAVMHADVNWNNKNDLYAANVGNYPSMDTYNEEMERIFNLDARYPENEGYEWDWDGDSQNRNRYDTWRNKSANYNNLQEFAVAGFIINRIISGFNILLKERNQVITSDFIKENNRSYLLKINYHF